MTVSLPTPNPSPKAKSLSHRAMHVGSWVLFEQAGSMVLRLISNLVLARMLAPDAYGLVTIIWTMIVGLALFSDMGIHRSVVQSPNSESASFLNTAWTIQMIRGAILAIVLTLVALGFALAGYLGWLPKGQIYGDERLPSMIGVMAVFMIITGFQSSRVFLAQRHMKQKVMTLMGLGTQVFSTVLMAWVAWLTHSHWTLVVGSLAAPLLARILERLFLEGPPERLILEPNAVKELMGQAKWLLPASILAFMGMHADRLILAGLIDAHTYGLYAMAYVLAGALQTLASVMINSVAFPALSEVVRTRPHDLSRVLRRFLWLFDAVFVTGFVALAVSSQTVVSILYDSRYTDVGWMLGLLALGSIGVRSQVVEQCYLAQAKGQYMTIAQAVRFSSMAAGIYLGNYLGGLYGMLVGVALSQCAGLPVAYWYQIRHGLLSWRMDILLVPAVIAGAGLGVLFNLAVAAVRG